MATLNFEPIHVVYNNVCEQKDPAFSNENVLEFVKNDIF